MAFPTVISNDGIVSPISILKSGTKVQSYGTKIPMGVIYDINIIKKSSREYFVSGIGDIVSNYTALLDWELAISCNKDSGNDFAQMLSKMSLDSLINIEFDIDSQKFINSFVYAVIISGLSMNIAGSSRPCSGAEHLIAHAIDNLNLTSYSHGFLVGSATMYVSFLHDRFDLGIFKYIEQVGLNCDFMSFLDIEFCELIDRAKVIRGDRFTILNKYSNKELEIRYNKFLNMIKEIK
jgi:glycerol-1-phosphate dehydrogenase [NAD(P)+]